MRKKQKTAGRNWTLPILLPLIRQSFSWSGRLATPRILRERKRVSAATQEVCACVCVCVRTCMWTDRQIDRQTALDDWVQRVVCRGVRARVFGCVRVCMCAKRTMCVCVWC